MRIFVDCSLLVEGCVGNVKLSVCVEPGFKGFVGLKDFFVWWKCENCIKV